MTMRIAYIKDWHDKKRGDIEMMARTDFLKLYNQEVAIPAITWEKEEAAAFAKEQAKKTVKKKPGRKKAISKQAETREKAVT